MTDVESPEGLADGRNGDLLAASQGAPETYVRGARYLCQVENDKGFAYVWNAARRVPRAGLLVGPPERAILDQLRTWTSVSELARGRPGGGAGGHLEATLRRLRAAELLVTSEDTTADFFTERFVVVGASVTNRYAAVETDAILRGADKIATIHPCDRPDSPLLALWHHKMVWLGRHLCALRDAREVLNAIANEYIELALRERHAVYLTFGHPFVGEAIPAFIQRNVSARFQEYVRILPAISSLDTMVTQLRVDPFADGPFAVLRPRDLAATMNPAVSTLLVLIGYEKCGIFSRMRQDEASLIREELAEIREVALRFFPPEHPVQLLTGEYDRTWEPPPPATANQDLPRDAAGNPVLPLNRLIEFASYWRSGASSLFIPRLGGERGA